jgi:hypothetical protein
LVLKPREVTWVESCIMKRSLICIPNTISPQSQRPRGLRRRSAAVRLLRFVVRIPPGIWMSVCCEWCVLSGRVFCDELITCPEDSYLLWRVVCDLETSRMWSWPAGVCCAKNKQILSVWFNERE